MSASREKTARQSVRSKTPIEIDVERTLADLLGGKELPEPIRTGKKIIKTPDSETTIEFELAVNPRTGQQEIVEHITTTKKECGRCGKTSSQLRPCYECSIEVCGECITSFHYGFGSAPIGTHKVCKSCFEGLSKSWHA